MDTSVKIVFVAAMCLLQFSVIASGENGSAKELFELNVIHINDFHARFDETSLDSNECRNEQECIGGLARVATVVKELKKRTNSIFLNAGDNYQGTLWYNMYKWNVTQHFMNLMQIDAYTLGNHEFDDKVAGIVEFLKRVKSPVVLCNMDDSLEPDIQGLYKKSTVLEVGGKRIGIIGVILSTVDQISSTEQLKFFDEVESINKEAQRLVDEEDVFTNIVLSHSGYMRELAIAAKAGPKVSLVVGGHSHSLLYNGTNPPLGEVEGPYPTVVGNDNSQMVLVVQASSYTKYLGNLSVVYDECGKIVSYDGAPIFLGHNVPKDEEMVKLLAPWKEEVDAYGSRIIGSTDVPLDNTGCYYEECNIGNMFADAIVDHLRDRAEGNDWTYAAIAVVNPGSIRTSIAVGNITFSDLLSVQPFENDIVVGEIEGKYIKEALEVGFTAQYSQRADLYLRVLQVSGIKLVADLSREPNDVITSVKVRSREGPSEDTYEELDPEKVYRISLGSFLANGGDGLIMFRDHLKNIIVDGVDRDIFETYITETSPITQGLEDRITVIHSDMEKLRRIKRNAQYYNSI